MVQSEAWKTAQHDPGDLRREMLEGHGGKLANMLVGLIINSNDAYERVGIEKPRKIKIEIDKTKDKTVKEQKGKARIRVIDWAEGMDYEEFCRNFESYGGPKSRWEAGKKISGLFGREASDIMWSNVAARYLCIKGEKGYVCEFKPIVDFRPNILDRRAVKQLRSEYAGSGALTVAEFYLNEDYRLPAFNALTDTLRKHFRLRLINQNKNVKISLLYIQQTGKKKNEAIINFEPLESEGEGADLIGQETFKMIYKKYPEFDVSAKLFKKKDRDLIQAGIDREGGLLIYADDDTVIDLNLFDFDESAFVAYNRRFFGYVRLGIADIIRKELRNASQKLALIEVDRSGLRRRNSEFYDNLRQILDGWLRPYIEKEQTLISSSSARTLTSDWNRKLKPLWADINKVISDKTGKTGKIIKPKGTPPNTLEFARDKIKTSEGMTYRIELLFNTQVIKSGTSFHVKSDNAHIHVSPEFGVIPNPNHSEFSKVARCTITICADIANEDAKIEASVPGYEPAILYVSSVEPDIHVPDDGIEWWPDEFEAAEGKISYPTLWVDMTNEKMSGSISITSKEKFIEIQDSLIELDKINILKDDPKRGLKVGKVRPRIKANGINNKGTVSANIDTLNDDLQVAVVDEKIVHSPGWWTFNGIDWEAHPSMDLDLYPNGQGKICFNINHPLMASYFGSNVDDAPTRVKKNHDLQLLAAHMVVDFICHQISRDAWRNLDSTNPNLEIGTRDPNRMDFQVYTYVMKLKEIYGVDWVERFTEVLSG